MKLCGMKIDAALASTARITWTGKPNSRRNSASLKKSEGGSALALAQSNLVRAQCESAFPETQFEIKIFKTTGDKLQTASLASLELPKGLFTKELENALLSGEADLAAFRDDLTHLLLYQKASFNSPVWFNCGIEPHPQMSACFINAVEDTLDSILTLAKTEGMLFKYGSGTGTNFSKIRANRESLSGGGKAIMPGMAGQRTVLGNHDAGMVGHPRAIWGVTRGNNIYVSWQQWGATQQGIIFDKQYPHNSQSLVRVAPYDTTPRFR